MIEQNGLIQILKTMTKTEKKSHENQLNYRYPS